MPSPRATDGDGDLHRLGWRQLGDRAVERLRGPTCRRRCRGIRSRSRSPIAASATTIDVGPPGHKDPLAVVGSDETRIDVDTIANAVGSGQIFYNGSLAGLSGSPRAADRLRHGNHRRRSGRHPDRRAGRVPRGRLRRAAARSRPPRHHRHRDGLARRDPDAGVHVQRARTSTTSSRSSATSTSRRSSRASRRSSATSSPSPRAAASSATSSTPSCPWSASRSTIC